MKDENMSNWMIFDPRIVFFTLWSTQIAGHLLITDVFNPLSSATWLIVLMMMLGFMAGCQIIAALNSKNSSIMPPESVPQEFGYSAWMNRLTPAVLIIYSIIAVLATSIVMARVGITEFQLDMLNPLRKLLINDLIEDRQYVWINRVYLFGVGMCIYLLCFSKNFSITKRLFIVLIGSISAILTTGRLYLLLFYLAVSYISFSLKIIKTKGLLVCSAIFLSLFIFLAVIFGKGGEDIEVSSQVLWNILVYFWGSLSSFDYYVNYGEPVISGGAILPNSVRIILEPIIGYLPLKPSVNPFVSNPIDSNTFTAIFPSYHDIGIFGAFIVFIILGMFHQSLFVWQKCNSFLSRYIYALSLYPLFMTIFEEAYLSSLGFWVTLLIVPLFFKIVYWININSSLKRNEYREFHVTEIGQ